MEREFERHSLALVHSPLSPLRYIEVSEEKSVSMCPSLPSRPAHIDTHAPLGEVSNDETCYPNVRVTPIPALELTPALEAIVML